MRFRPDEEQLAFARSLGELLADADTPAIARAWAAGDPAPGRKLWTRLAEQGVLSLGADDSGATPVDLVLAFEQLGRFAVPGPYVESVAVLPALGVEAGEAMATLAAPPRVPYALDAPVADAVYLLDGSVLSAATASAAVGSVDRARLLAEVRPVGQVREVEPAGAFERGVLAVTAQLVGLGSALLDRSVGYARQRSQFGKPIGSFQAVKHQLADVAVGLELARPLLFGAALGLDGPDAAREVSAAKVAGADAAYRAARTALQVHGAIGYTAEYDLALWLTKVRALVAAWGTPRFHRDRVLAALRAGPPERPS
jgi:alkylation response protein AidB-like acyl-CoA dehydrogenase